MASTIGSAAGPLSPLSLASLKRRDLQALSHRNQEAFSQIRLLVIYYKWLALWPWASSFSPLGAGSRR